MWYVASNLEDALKVCQAWGFTYKTKGWTWVKLAKNGKPRMGQGYIVRHATEDCLIATRGKVGRPQYKSELDLIFAPFDPVHSRKPAEQYAKIDRLYPDLWPRLEMFARETQPGWDVFGNQVDGSIDVSPSRIQLSFV
jgi:N6-adenosine-specific RNA methylase IME4